MFPNVFFGSHLSSNNKLTSNFNIYYEFVKEKLNIELSLYEKESSFYYNKFIVNDFSEILTFLIDLIKLSENCFGIGKIHCENGSLFVFGGLLERVNDTIDDCENFENEKFMCLPCILNDDLMSTFENLKVHLITHHLPVFTTEHHHIRSYLSGLSISTNECVLQSSNELEYSKLITKPTCLKRPHEINDSNFVIIKKSRVIEITEVEPIDDSLFNAFFENNNQQLNDCVEDLLIPSNSLVDEDIIAIPREREYFVHLKKNLYQVILPTLKSNNQYKVNFECDKLFYSTQLLSLIQANLPANDINVCSMKNCDHCIGKNLHNKITIFMMNCSHEIPICIHEFFNLVLKNNVDALSKLKCKSNCLNETSKFINIAIKPSDYICDECPTLSTLFTEEKNVAVDKSWFNGLTIMMIRMKKDAKFSYIDVHSLCNRCCISNKNLNQLKRFGVMRKQ